MKDPNAPKRPLSGYMLFCNDNRTKFQKANPDASMTGLSKILGGAWGKLSDAAKKPYQARATKAKKVYEDKMAKYKKTDNYAKFKAKNDVGGIIKKVCKSFNIACKKRNPTSFPQDPNAPKRAPSAYFLFANSVRDKVQKKYSGEPASVVMKEIGQMWKKCSDTAKFEKMAEKEKKKAAEKKKKYEKTSSYKNYQAAVKEYQKLKKKL